MARGISGRALGGTSSLGKPVFAISTDITAPGADGTYTIGPEKAPFDFDVLGAFFQLGAAGSGSDTLKITIVDGNGATTDLCTAFDLNYHNPGQSGSGAQGDEGVSWVRLLDSVTLTVPSGGKLTCTVTGGGNNVTKVTALCTGR